MIQQLYDNLWIGNSAAENYEDIFPVTAILNVARDLPSTRCGLEANRIGLVDGPGNDVDEYCAAVLALRALLKRNNVLVCCHTGSRALAVGIMYMMLESGSDWDNVLSVLKERLQGLPEINDAHRSISSTVVKELV